ncbi:cucumber peeling cupredoxin [Lactuca sativa]|uniref:Phytocyanin domain-containing protein n=1 Tax=Lactuca sativa TaxID=4236 RepID=A0A9R1VE37_LACSA|nr:cucumber peeling cupredoxin [Lactuca sativa]KAJ0203006.1 hypothetical protein LSAT_V11C500263150 [Lactuca sativa]
MAGSMKSCMVMLMMMMVASMQMQSSIAQTRHVVGDALGWTIPPNGAAAYTTWASQQNFTVGDSLVFNFTTGAHNVAEVSQAAYGPCTTTNPISIATAGPATLTLTTPGTHYYVCTVGSHCQIGQKLTVNVVAAAAAPTTPPPAPTPTTPPPAATPTPTPTPSPVSPPTTSPTPAPGPSTTITPPTSSPAPSPVGDRPPSPPESSPSPTGSTTPSPAGDSTPPPPAPSNAASLMAAVPVTFLAFALAFFY